MLAVHSLRRHVGTAVADRLPQRLAHLVYVDAVVPKPVKAGAHASPATQRARLAAAAARRPQLPAARPGRLRPGRTTPGCATPDAAPGRTYTEPRWISTRAVARATAFINCTQPTLATIDVIRPRVRTRASGTAPGCQSRVVDPPGRTTDGQRARRMVRLLLERGCVKSDSAAAVAPGRPRRRRPSPLLNQSRRNPSPNGLGRSVQGYLGHAGEPRFAGMAQSCPVPSLGQFALVQLAARLLLAGNTRATQSRLSRPSATRPFIHLLRRYTMLPFRLARPPCCLFRSPQLVFHHWQTGQPTMRSVPSIGFHLHGLEHGPDIKKRQWHLQLEDGRWPNM